LVIAAIITYSAAPLVWRCCVILMQSVPAGVDIDQLTKDLEEVTSPPWPVAMGFFFEPLKYSFSHMFRWTPL